MENIQDNILAYVNGQLSGAELTEFEAQLKTDKDLVEEVTLYRQLQFSMQNAELIEMNKTLSQIRIKNGDIRPDFDIEPQYILPKSGSTTSWRWWKSISTSIAASRPDSSKSLRWWAVGILVLGLISLALWQYSKSLAVENAQKVSTVLLQEVTPFENVISLANDDKSPLAEGMRAYDAKNYSAAVTSLKLHTQRQPNDVFSKLYLGISYLLSDDDAEAIRVLQPLAQNSDNEVATTAQWHLAMAYLQKGEIGLAKPFLEGLKEHPRFGSYAVKTLSDLE